MATASTASPRATAGRMALRCASRAGLEDRQRAEHAGAEERTGHRTAPELLVQHRGVGQRALAAAVLGRDQDAEPAERRRPCARGRAPGSTPCFCSATSVWVGASRSTNCGRTRAASPAIRSARDPCLVHRAGRFARGAADADPPRHARRAGRRRCRRGARRRCRCAAAARGSPRASPTSASVVSAAGPTASRMAPVIQSPVIFR